MKPDELYRDKGLSSNERVVEEEISKPDSLSLKKSATKKAAPHFSQLVQSENASKQQQQQSDHHHLTPTASPKPSRSALKNAGSRSPSPATTTTTTAAGVSISRKSSFCSLFKSKEAASPDSPSGQRKKSAISILLDSPRDRDRSRSKSRESEKSGCSGGLSANTTPSKQRSVLAIFKPRRGSSKSSSPIDPEMHEIMSKQTEHHSRKQMAKQKDAHEEQFQQRPGSTTPRLRYYENPNNPSEGIYIPLKGTPPDEKENVTFASTIASTGTRHTPSTQHVASNVDAIEPAPIQTITTAAAATTSTIASPALPQSSATKSTTPVNERRAKTITKCVVSTSTTPTASAQPKIKKSYRIELPDGSIRIPLRSPSDEHAPTTETIDEAADNNSQQEKWSTAVQRNSSQDSQDTVVSSKAASLGSGGGGELVQSTKTKSSSVITTVATVQTPPITATVVVVAAATTAPESKTETETPTAKQVSQEETTVVTIENGGIRAMSKERKRILFSTKIGSGSEEQIFATQLSLSKTESLSSQLSEQGPNLESPTAEKPENAPREEQKTQQQLQSHSHSQGTNQNEVIVRMRPKEDKEIEIHATKQDAFNVNRHSMYIENIEEIMETQRRLESERKSSLLAHAAERTSSAESSGGKQSAKPMKPERCSKGQSPKSRENSGAGASGSGGAGSSGSEHDSETDIKV